MRLIVALYSVDCPQGQLSLVQGAVLSEMQGQLAAASQALALSDARAQAAQAELAATAAGLNARLAAESKERERLALEAAQVTNAAVFAQCILGS